MIDPFAARLDADRRVCYACLWQHDAAGLDALFGCVAPSRAAMERERLPAAPPTIAAKECDSVRSGPSQRSDCVASHRTPSRVGIVRANAACVIAPVLERAAAAKATGCLTIQAGLVKR